MEWKSVIANLGFFTIGTFSVSTLLFFLIRSLTDNLLKKDLEKFKIELQAESEIEKVKYSILQQKRGEVVAEAYSLLAKFENSMKDLIALFQPAGTLPENEKTKIAAADGNNFLNFYNQHKIYFKKETCEIIDEINKKFRNAWTDFQFKDKIRANKAEEDLWLKAWKSLDEEIPLIKDKLENDFRKIIGVE